MPIQYTGIFRAKTGGRERFSEIFFKLRDMFPRTMEDIADTDEHEDTLCALCGEKTSIPEDTEDTKNRPVSLCALCDGDSLVAHFPARWARSPTGCVPALTRFFALLEGNALT